MSDEIKQYLEPGKKNLILIYILYLFGTIGPILPIIGAVFAFANKTNSNNLYSTHYTFAFRSFCLWLCGVLVAMIFTFANIGLLLKILIFVWFIVRSIIALQYLLEKKPHPNPLTLWIK
jgi:uncharacterized membrane protein